MKIKKYEEFLNENFNASGFFQGLKKYLLPTTELSDILVQDDDPVTSKAFVEIAIPYKLINTGTKHNKIVELAKKYARFEEKQMKFDADRQQLRLFFRND